VTGLLSLVLVLLAAGDEDACDGKLRVLSSRVTLRTPMFKGEAMRRDAELDIELASTSTAPITQVELGVFLGASLRVIGETRVSALPTARPRELEGGGVAFRSEVAVFIPPGATRTVHFEKRTIPLDRDVSSVTAVIAGCRSVRPLSGDATIDPRAEDQSGYVTTLSLIAFGIGLVMIVVILLRLLR
jgi:hypothetical protein